MSYQVKCDNYILYTPSIEELTIADTTLSLSQNKAGSFSFRMFPDHPYITMLQRLRSIITVMDDGDVIFRGRILDTDEDWINSRRVLCEGDLAFLNDSIVEPYVFQGRPENIFKYLIGQHNAQADAAHQFVVGRITVTDPNDYINRSWEDYLSVWEIIKSRLLQTLGGIIQTRYEEGKAYIDYLAESDILSTQPVRYALNLMDLSKSIKGSEIATAILPLGKKDESTKKYLDISSVNDGSKILRDEDAIEKYGFICKTQVWNDVTDPTNLMRKGQARLAEMVALPQSIIISAADLSSIEKGYGSFRLNRMVRVTSQPHNVSGLYQINALTINLLEPAANRLNIGKTQSGIVEQNAQTNSQLVERIEYVSENIAGIAEAAADEAVQGIENRVQSMVDQSADSITTMISDSYYLKEETDAMFASQSTQINQTAEAIELQFNNFEADLAALSQGTDARFQDISRYIRFAEGNIEMGEINSPFKQLMTNEKNSFMDNGYEVAYFSNQKMYVTDAEITTSLQLGKFAFVPRANGNLSFKKVVN